MSYPQDPYGQRPFTYDPLGRVPSGSPPPVEYPAEAPIYLPPAAPPPALPYREPVNTLATLSLVFAFVFAPAGALLGHLGLAQIRRTGERGRDRAVVAVTLSYVFITLSIVALVAWVSVAATSRQQTAAPPPVTTTPPPPATVAPEDLPGLLPGTDALRDLAGDPNLKAGQSWHQIARYDREGTLDRAECYGTLAPGTPEAYDVATVLGFFAKEASDVRDPRNEVQILPGVAAFRDEHAAQAELTRLQSIFRQCGGADVKVNFPSGQVLTVSLSLPIDAGDGITTMGQSTAGTELHTARAIAAKANIVIDLNATYGGSTAADRSQKAAVAVAKFILGKIPG